MMNNADAVESKSSFDKDQLLPNGNNGKNQPKIVSTTLAPGTYYPYEKGLCRSRRTCRIKKRAVSKKGNFNVEKTHITRGRFTLMPAFFTGLVEARWRWTLIFGFLITVAIILLFACIWWLICYAHGDLEPENHPDLQGQTGWVPCITHMYSFTSFFLFSVEIQTTVGYGTRHSNEECPETIVVMCLQNLTGLIISAFIVGIVFAKLTRPKHRTNTLVFSKNAVVAQRNQRLCLMFRVGDVRKSRILNTTINAFVIRARTTREGEFLEHDQVELTVQVDACEESPFFIWPITVVHVIDSNSPFYKTSASDLLRKNMEVVAVLEGLIESTGQDIQARSSYITSEILWGHRFAPMVSYNNKRKGYDVDYAKFDTTTKISTPLCSAKDFEKLCAINKKP